jgi:hypothetical protein
VATNRQAGGGKPLRSISRHFTIRTWCLAASTCASASSCVTPVAETPRAIDAPLSASGPSRTKSFGFGLGNLADANGEQASGVALEARVPAFDHRRGADFYLQCPWDSIVFVGQWLLALERLDPLQLRLPIEEFRWGARALRDLRTAWECLNSGDDPLKAKWANSRMVRVGDDSSHAEWTISEFLERTLRDALEGFSPRMWLVEEGSERPSLRAIKSPAPNDVTLFEVLAVELFRHICE